MRTTFIFFLLVASASAQTQTPGPTPSQESVKGSETDQQRANDAICLNKLTAQNPPLQGRQRFAFMTQCKNTSQ